MLLAVTSAGTYSTWGMAGVPRTVGGFGVGTQGVVEPLQAETRSKLFPITPESTIDVVVSTKWGAVPVGSAFATSHGFTNFGAIGVMLAKLAGL